ncbi:MAG: hypothetical protein HW387_1479 [Parachlamydiales bacterium]|nr:hypothetical protein [Parachlamydiales bacterium]
MRCMNMTQAAQVSYVILDIVKKTFEELLLERRRFFTPLKEAVRQSRIPQNKIACRNPTPSGGGRGNLPNSAGSGASRLVSLSVEDSPPSKGGELQKVSEDIPSQAGIKSEPEFGDTLFCDIPEPDSPEFEGWQKSFSETNKKIAAVLERNRLEELFNNINR